MTDDPQRLWELAAYADKVLDDVEHTIGRTIDESEARGLRARFWGTMLGKVQSRYAAELRRLTEQKGSR